MQGGGYISEHAPPQTAISTGACSARPYSAFHNLLVSGERVPANAGRGETVQATASVVAAAATKSEDNKAAFMTAGVGSLFREGLASSKVLDDPVKAVSRAVRKLTTADDDRPVVSRCICTSFSCPCAYINEAVSGQRLRKGCCWPWNRTICLVGAWMSYPENKAPAHWHLLTHIYHD
jgi:hypothetical protein